MAVHRQSGLHCARGPDVKRRQRGSDRGGGQDAAGAPPQTRDDCGRRLRGGRAGGRTSFATRLLQVKFSANRGGAAVLWIAIGLFREEPPLQGPPGSSPVSGRRCGSSSWRTLRCPPIISWRLRRWPGEPGAAFIRARREHSPGGFRERTAGEPDGQVSGDRLHRSGAAGKGGGTNDHDGCFRGAKICALDDADLLG